MWGFVSSGRHGETVKVSLGYVLGPDSAPDKEGT